jgi:hypothetical protein
MLQCTQTISTRNFPRQKIFRYIDMSPARWPALLPLAIRLLSAQRQLAKNAKVTPALPSFSGFIAIIKPDLQFLPFLQYRRSLSPPCLPNWVPSMKTLNTLLAMLSLLLSLCAQAQTQSPNNLSLSLSALPQTKPPDFCSPAVTKNLSDEQEVSLIRDTVTLAVETLDNAKLVFSTPILIPKQLNYVTVTPAFPDNQKNLCVLGYFERKQDGKTSTAPLDVDHIEEVKIPNPKEPGQFIVASRIFFVGPTQHNLSLRDNFFQFWNLWSGPSDIHLVISAFEYKDGQLGKPHFGRNVEIQMSHEHASLTAALLFALLCYISAAITIGYRAGAKEETFPSTMSGLRIFLKKLSPWYVVGSTGQASLSQLQMLLFTLIVATLLFYQWIRTGVLQDLSTDLLYLIGISTAGAGGSQITKSLKKTLDKDIYEYLQRLGWFTAPLSSAHTGAHPSELLLTDNRFDIYKFQMFVFTVVVAAYVISAGSSQLGNIQISTTLLTLMGMSQGAYLGGKATADIITPLQDQLRGMQLIQKTFDDAAANPVLQQQMLQRFQSTALMAADMFRTIFYREVPPEMLSMNLLAKPDSITISVETSATVQTTTTTETTPAA